MPMKLYLIEVPQIGTLLIKARSRLSMTEFIMERFFTKDTVSSNGIFNQETELTRIEAQIYVAACKAVKFECHIPGNKHSLLQQYCPEEFKEELPKPPSRRLNRSEFTTVYAL